MTLQASDLKFRKAIFQTDTPANGGRKGMIEVISGARHALFPRVTKSQREAGIVRHRKQFLCNENAANAVAYGMLVYLMRPSVANDIFYLAKGTQRDTQADFARKDDIDTYAATAGARLWTGCGQLETALVGGETEVSLTMEADDFEFEIGGYLYLSNNTKTSQTVDADVKIGDSVLFSGGTWSKIAHTNDIAYPNGWFVGSGQVVTEDSNTKAEFLEIDSFTFVGDVAVISLVDPVANAYSTAGTFGSGCLYEAEVTPEVSAWAESMVAGTYDETTYPVETNNKGAVEDDWTITFTSGSTFSVSGANTGSVGTGSTGSDFSPENAATATPYFTLRAAGWGGTLASGDIVTFTTSPAAVPILLCQEVPTGTEQEPNNVVLIGSYTE